MESSLTIIQQNDTHGCLELHNELYWDTTGPILKKAGGFSRINKYVTDLKKQKSNVLFFDGGDLFHGTLPLISSKGSAILPLLKKMNLDGFVPGNWDFAYGKEQLKNLIKGLPFPTIASNVTEKETGNYLVKPYVIKEMEGLKAGIVGLTYPYVDQTMPPDFSEGLMFKKGVAEIKRALDLLKGEVDIIVLLSHMGLPLDVKLASLVSGIDIILSGHSHERVKKPIVVNDTYIVQAGASSSFLGRIDITLNNGKLVELDYELINVSEDLEEDKEVQEIVQGIIKPFNETKRTIVGETNTVLHRMTLMEAPMDRLITDAYKHAYSCDLAFSHGWRYGPPMATGTLSLFDLHSIIPTNPKMFIMELEGREIWEILENNLEQVFSADPFEQKGGYILRFSGLFMTFKPYNPKGYRIQQMQVAGDDIDLGKTYKIVGGGEQLFKGHSKRKSYQNDHAIDVIQLFLKEKGPYAPQMGDIISI